MPGYGLTRALFAPLRTAQRVADNIETIASALLSLERDTHERLVSVDQKLTELQKLERAVTDQTEAIREDLNTRLIALEEEVLTMRSPIEKMAIDLATVVKLLPNPSDGPLARLRDTLSSS
jgi:hypothetical protein